MCIKLYRTTIIITGDLVGNVKCCESQGAANCTTNGSPCLTSMLSTAAAAASDLSVTWGGEVEEGGRGGKVFCG